VASDRRRLSKAFASEPPVLLQVIIEKNGFSKKGLCKAFFGESLEYGFLNITEWLLIEDEFLRPLRANCLRC